MISNLIDYVIKDDVFKSIEEEIICSICSDIKKDPYMCSKCQNSFCKICIEKWKKKSKVCPFKCNNPTYSSIRLIKNLLSKLHFKCPNGCDVKIPYDNIEKHLDKECKKIEYKKKYEHLLSDFDSLNIKYNELEKKYIELQKKLENYEKGNNRNNIENLNNITIQFKNGEKDDPDIIENLISLDVLRYKKEYYTRITQNIEGRIPKELRLKLNRITVNLNLLETNLGKEIQPFVYSKALQNQLNHDKELLQYFIQNNKNDKAELVKVRIPLLEKEIRNISNFL